MSDFEIGDAPTTLYQELLNWHQDEIVSESEVHDLSTRLMVIIDKYRPEPDHHVITVLNHELAMWDLLWGGINDAIFDKAEGFTCSEANLITEHVRRRGDVQWANAFAKSHAAGDEEGDEHYGG